MSILRKLAGQTAIYGMSISCCVALLSACSLFFEKKIEGDWTVHRQSPQSEGELQFMAGDSFALGPGPHTPPIDPLSLPLSSRGTYQLSGDSIQFNSVGGRMSFRIRWLNKDLISLRGDRAYLALSRKTK